jgi:hypothetical protein
LRSESFVFPPAVQDVKVTTCNAIILPFVLYGWETWSLTLRKEHRLRVFKNRVLRIIFGPKRGEVPVTGEWSFIICTHPKISLGRSNEGERSGQGMWHV